MLAHRAITKYMRAYPCFDQIFRKLAPMECSIASHSRSGIAIQFDEYSDFAVCMDIVSRSCLNTFNMLKVHNMKRNKFENCICYWCYVKS